MRFSFEVGKVERHRVEFYRSAMVGTMTVTVDGHQVNLRSALNPLTHFSFTLKKHYTLVVGVKEEHEVTIEHERPLLFAGFRPQTYRVFVDGEFLEEHRGF